MTRRLRFVFPLVALGLLPGLSARGATDFPERKTLTAGDYSIEYSAGDEEFARALLDQLRKNDAATASSAPPAADPLGSQGPALLAAACRYLALAKPDSSMEKVFADTLQGHRAIDEMAQSAVQLRNFQLWRGPDLKARLDAGVSIPGLVRTADGVSWQFTSTGKPGETPRITARIPALITSHDLESDDALVQKKAKEVAAYGDAFAQLGAFNRARATFLALHEAIETTIVGHHLKSADRRWFCDGVANYVAWKVIEERVGAEAARPYYDLQADLSQYADLKGRIDLARWPAVENQGKLDEAGERMNKACYPFATEVMATVCAKHGPDLLPRLFAEIDRTPFERRTIKTVYRAFKRLTGEDLRSYFPK